MFLHFHVRPIYFPFSITENSTTLGEYTYDALGRRTKKVAGGITTLYIYDQNGLLIDEYDGSGNWQKDYLYLNEQPLTMIVAGTPENVYYYHNDHLGTPQIMTDNTGAVVWSAQYEPFGETTIAPSSATTNNLRFPGQYFDVETGLHYNWHRYYKPEIGRYIEGDPIGLEGGINIYTYVANRPTIYADPAGLWFPYRHGQYTFEAAREAGCSINEANKLAVETAKVDFREGANDPENAHWNGMVDGSINGDPARSIREYINIQKKAFHTCDLGELALAIHALQDTYAPAHRFKPWNATLFAWLKHYSDSSVPSDSTLKNINNLSRSLIENARRRCPPCLFE